MMLTKATVPDISSLIFWEKIRTKCLGMPYLLKYMKLPT